MRNRRRRDLPPARAGRTTALVAALLALLALAAGCPSKPQVWTPPPDRSAGLPGTVPELVELADKVAADGARDPGRVDRGLAALELAHQQSETPDFEVLWRLGRAGFLMTEALGASRARTYAEAGQAHAARAVELDATRVEGHYYMALNMAKVAEATTDVELLKPMMAVAERASEIDAAYDDAGPLRLMGKTYIVAPEWPTSVGDREAAVEVLTKALSLAPTTLNRLFLGQAFYHAEEYDKAEAQLRRALKDAKAQRLDERWVDEAEDYLRRMGAQI